MIYEHDDNYDKYIAALVYQVRPENALSAVYVTSLKRALEQGNKDELERISKASFFSDILDEAIDAVENLDDAIVSIDMLPQNSLDEIRTKKLWRDLYNKADEGDLARINENEFYFGVIKESQEVLLEHVEGEHGHLHLLYPARGEQHQGRRQGRHRYPHRVHHCEIRHRAQNPRTHR